MQPGDNYPGIRYASPRLLYCGGGPAEASDMTHDIPYTLINK